MNNSCIIGLDRDGVINQELGDYCYKVENFVPIPGSLEAIAKLKNHNYIVVVITNQGGIEKGLFTSKEVNAVHNYLFDLLKQFNCSGIDALYCSPSSKVTNHLAKPNTGMFELCEKEFNVKFKDGFYVGDKLKDLQAADNIGARPVLVRTGYGLETEKELDNFVYKELKNKTLIFNDLKSFVESIL